MRVWQVISIPPDCVTFLTRDFDCDYPGPVLVSWRLRPGRPSGPSSRAGFPLRPRSPGRFGVSDEPCRPSRVTAWRSRSRAPGCGGHFARSRVVCGCRGRVPSSSLRLPGVARGPWPHASPRPVGCPRGGTGAAALGGALPLGCCCGQCGQLRHPLSSSGVSPVLSLTAP